jgi:hypothetical protein
MRKFVNILSIALIIIVTSKIGAMNDVPMSNVQLVQAVEQAPTVHHASIATTDGICHLARLPADVLNYITQFVTSETQTELIERTCVPKEVPCQYYEQLLTPIGVPPSRQRNIRVEFCPDQTKFVLFEELHGLSKKTLTIFDLKKQQKMYTQDLNKPSICLVGLSRCGQMFANIQRNVDPFTFLMVNKGVHSGDVLVIKNIVTNQIQEIFIPNHSLDTISICFNKQGTHLIMHRMVRRDSRWTEEECRTKRTRDHLIFELAPDVKIEEETIAKTLNEYFKRNRVCNNIANQSLSIQGDYTKI